MPDPLERFFAKVEIADCWYWTAVRQKTKGYGQFRADGSMRQAHRWLWEQLVGPIPEGLELDHLCRVRHCVNPDHLEPVTHRENVIRTKATQTAALRAHWARVHAETTHCPRGHEFTPENTQRYARRRQCRQCNRDDCKKYAALRKQAKGVQA